MRIIHCLFWIKDNHITSLLYDSGKPELLKIKGYKAVPFTDTFWEEWCEYAGLCQGDKIDFCLIYDEKANVDETLMHEQCEEKDCIWSRNKIQEAVKVLEITEPVEIRNENGMLLAKAGSFLNVRKEDILLMTAWYRKANKDDEETVILLEQKTPFIKHYMGELKEYKKGYEI